MVYKTNESIIVIQAEAINPNRTDVVFWSHDRGTAKLRMKLVRKNGIPQSLPEGTTVPIRLMFRSATAEGGYGKHDYLATIDDRVNGIVSIVLEDNILGYVGTVEGSVYIDFPNDQSLDTAGRFTFDIKRSPIDDSTPELEDYYFNGFSQTIDKVEKIISDAKTEIDEKVAESETQIDTKLKDTNDKITKANQDVATLNTNIDKANDRIVQTNQQIGDLGKLKRMYSNSIDFGGKGSSLSDFLDAPYYLSKVPLQENIANRAVQFPISSSNYTLYSADMQEPYIAGETYTVTISATKPSAQTFRVYSEGTTDYYFGDLKPVEGLVDVWSLTFTTTKVSSKYPKLLQILQYPAATVGACKIDWLKIEKGDTRTPNISQFKYFGEGLKDSNDPNDYSWDITPEYTEKGLNDSVSLTEPETILGLKNFAEGLQSSGVNVAVEYAKATDADKYTKHGAIYLGGCAWLAWETLTFQKTEGYAKGSYIRLGADGNASFTYSDVPNIFGGYLWLGGVCQPDYKDGGFGSYHITVENNFDDARKPIVRFIDSPTTPVKKLAVRGFALVFAPAPTENSQVKE
ncbi:BppU family phage baseplate upper protein [Enterococcus durans]|uniref:BppU family phage baseplate upper protein n=1 Tax=Enterococcus durans TaxID=53345 RepID=UPI0020744942|nr:BppU family phage baseplate upper protein [Enterococcus durans]MCM6856339.1 BppU family phage baseplate upper protein [Enterococcus durans]